MAIRTRAELKALFENGDQPDGDAFADLIDSFCHMAEALPSVSGAALTGIAATEWIAQGDATYVDASTFTQSGNHVDVFLETRRVRALLLPSTYVTAHVQLSSYDMGTDTTTVKLDSPVLTVALDSVAISFLTPLQYGGAVSPLMLGGMRKSEIVGLLLSNSPTYPNTRLVIAAGEARDSNDLADIQLTSDLVKRADQYWALGDNAGGMLSPYTLSGYTCYAVWLMMDSSTGDVDVGFSEDFTAPTLPSGYDRSRLLGFFSTNAAAQIRSFVQVGDYFHFIGNLSMSDYVDSSLTTGVWETGSVVLPPNSLAYLALQLSNTGATGSAQHDLRLRPKGATDQPPGHSIVTDSASLDAINFMQWMYLDENSEFEYMATFTSGTPSMGAQPISCLMFSRSVLG